MSVSNQIQSLQFQLEIPSAAHNKDIQNEIVDIFNYGLQPMLDRLLSSFSVAGNAIGFESIELTLDPIPLDALKDELLEKTEAALKEYLEIAFKQLYTVKNNGTTTASNGKSTVRQLYSVTKTATLTYFLTHGHYPWWEKEANIPLSHRWITALQKEKKQFTAQLFRLGKKRRILKRMAYQLEDEALKSTVTAVEPGGADSVFAFQEHLLHQQQQKPLIRGTTASDFSKTIWEFTLVHLFMEMGTAFNRKMFLKSQVKQIAQHYNSTYREVLSFLHKGLEKLAESDIKKTTLFSTLKTLEEERISEEKPSARALPADDMVSSFKKILKKTSYTRKDREKIARYITQLKKSRHSRKRFFKQLTLTEFQHLIAFMVPQETTFINEYLLKTAYFYKKDPVVSVPQDNFMMHIREMVAVYLFSENTTVFNRKMFVKAQISQIAQHYNIPEDRMMQFLAQGFGDMQALNPDSVAFFNILKLLLEEREADKEKTATTPEAYPEESGMILLKPLLSLRFLSAKEYDMFTALLENYRKSNKLRSVTALPEAELFKILYHFSPEHHLFIRNYLENVVLLHSKISAAVSATALQEKAWYFSIEALITAQGSVFSAKAFIEQQLKKLASHFNLEYVTVLFQFMEDAETSGKMPDPLLKDTLETLYLEEHVTPSVFKKIAEKTDFSTYISQIIYFLQFGSYPPDGPQISKSVLEQVFKELLLNYREALYNNLKTYGLAREQSASLPGLRFFAADTVTVWEQFRKRYFDSDPVEKSTVSDTLTNTQYKNILAFYLKTGALPWWAGSLSVKNVMVHLLEAPEVFRSFIKEQQWTLAVVKRIYALFNENESKAFLNLIIEEHFIEAGVIINSALQEIIKHAGGKKPDEAFLLFVLQNTKHSLTPETFIKEYIKQFCEENSLQYGSFILQSSEYLEETSNPVIRSLFEKEKTGVTVNDYTQIREELVQLYPAGSHTGKQREKLSLFISDKDRNTVARLLKDLVISKKKALHTSALYVFLEQLHPEDHTVIRFFKKIAQLRKITSVYNVFPGFYEAALQFYIDYISLKNIKTFDFNEFIMRWFAYMEQKDKAKSIKLRHVLAKHSKKDSPWMDKFMLYFSGSFPVVPASVKESETLSEEPPPIHNIGDMEDIPADTLTEKILIFNSGLVLVWPFLTHFFKALKYVEENAFVSPGMQERAVCLLHYIATGACENIGEEQLVINKLLCGVHVTQPVRNTILPTKQEEELVESMLKAVIARWSKIGNTSIDGLRGSYIIREGYLEEEENGYQLSIEKKGYDILLDHLPWKLELIKFPWMKKPLYVSWR